MTDIRDDFATFAKMGYAQKAKFLALLSFELTLHARGFVLDLPPDRALGKLRSINELQHKTLSQLGAYLEHRSARYPDEAFWKVLVEMAVKSDLSSEFLSSARTALSRV